MRRTRNLVLVLLTLAGMVGQFFVSPLAAQVKVVTSLTTYGAIAREIVGDRASVTSRGSSG